MSNATNDNLADDKELNEYLGGDTQYSRRYRAIEADAVPAELDALVLGSVATDNVVPIGAAVEKSRSARRKPLAFWMRMGVPVTLAASFVLALSFMIDSDLRRTSTPMIQPELDTDVASPRKEASYVAPAEVQQFSANEQKQTTDKRDSFGAPSPPPATLAKSTLPDQSRKLAPQAPPPAPTESARAANRTDAVETPAETNLEQVVVTAQQAPRTVEDSALPVDVISAEDSSPMQRGSGAIGLDEIVVTAQKRESARGSAGPRNSIPPSSFADREPSEAELAKQYREENPVAWLAYIRELRSANKSREADREWQRFVKAHPTYSVDEADTARPKKK